ncbi:MAG: hypothetical protein P1U56_08555 [Saprospiraceae bacterium]|nr:hypothetical protein [Saprospiraceae bacterium]
MSKERTLFILWILFGFVFVQAVDSILYFVVHIFYFIAAAFGISLSALVFIVPAFTFILYAITIFILLNTIKISSDKNGILLTKFPKPLFLFLLMLAIALNPITNRLSGLFAEYTTGLESEGTVQYLEFYGWMHAGIGISRIVSVIALGFIYLKKYQYLK